MAEIEALSAKLDAYLQDPQDSLDLSCMGFGAKGAEKVALFLPKCM
jgi:hypothetical protein